MSSGSAEIKTIPSPRSRALSGKHIGGDFKAAGARQHENEFKYTYDFGFRQFSNTLVDFREDTNNNYSYPQDVELIVICQAERGYCLAHAEIKVDQSSDEHEASIIDGGIGEDHISILVKAQNTYWFNYESRIYAKKVPLTVVPLIKTEV